MRWLSSAATKVQVPEGRTMGVWSGSGSLKVQVGGCWALSLLLIVEVSEVRREWVEGGCWRMDWAERLGSWRGVRRVVSV